MKETKVYMELPNGANEETCDECPYAELGEVQHYFINNEIISCRDCICKLDKTCGFRHGEKHCPLIDIKIHDREKDKRIKELEQKVQELQEVDNKRAFRLYAVLYDVLEKQDPENVASRIEYMTRDNYADICEIYKTVKNLKQHDRELVKEVCDEIKNKLGSIEDILINLGNGKEDALSYFMYILNKIQKEFEK